MKYKPQLKTLRKKLPISIKQGLKLLNQTNGNIEAATQLFKEITFEQLNSKIELKPETAQNLLLETNYNLDLALKKAEKIRFSTTEIILRKSINNRDKIGYIVSRIEQDDNLTRRYITYTKEELEHLSFYKKVVVTLFSWIDDHENTFEFDIGGQLTTDACHYINDIFEMPYLAEIVKKADKLFDEIVLPWYRGMSSEESRKRSKSLSNLQKDSLFEDYKSIFIKGRQELYEKLIEFIEVNIGEFP